MRFLLLVPMLVPALARAQDAPPEPPADVPADPIDQQPRVVYKARTELDFEILNVNAPVVHPEGQLLVERKRASFNPLIRIRSEWDTEMKSSIDAVK